MKLWIHGRALLISSAIAAGLVGCGGDSSTDTAAATPVSPPAITAPTITTQPLPVAVSAGASATFTVVASGGAPLSYQWQRNTVAIAGATGASYTLAATTEADSGASFRVVVSNAAGSVTSSGVALTVGAAVQAPAVAVQPQSGNALDGTTATLSVVATGTAPFTYAWRRNGVAIADASDATYTTPALGLADSGAVFAMTVSNAAGSAVSSNAVITVNPVAAAVATPPLAVSVAAGQTATFSVAATGSATLAYQWQRNGAAIAGATAASYTTPATTVADSGARFRVVVSNGGGSVTSADAVLSVTAAVVAPAIATAPLPVTASEGQTATFTAAATGTAPLAYQWRRNGVDIAGASSASYTTPALALADSGARFTVRVSNAAGTATSADALLTVQAAVSVLQNRSWATAQSLETDDGEVSSTMSVIDDSGRATVLFRKVTSARTVVYATRGSANATAAAPTWGAPVAIDLLAGSAVSTMTGNSPDIGLAVSPAGNVLAYWPHSAPCGPTTYQTSGTCVYYYSARYLAASNAWEAPVLVGDTPNTGITPRINDRGDVALLGTSWGRSASGTLTKPRAVYLRSAADSGFRRVLFGTDPIANPMLDLDNAGNLLLAVEASQNATVDLVAYRGTVAAGFGAAQVLDTRGAAASLQLAGVGLNGQQVIVWAQNNGVQDTNYAATSATPGGSFAVVDLGYRLNTSIGFRRLTVADDGQAIVFDLSARKRLRWTAAGGWLAVESLPATLPNNPYFYGVASTRNGDLLAVQLGGAGDWASYDATRNVLVQAPPSSSPGPGYVLGLSKNAGYADLNLALNGLAIVTLQNKFDVLPTPAAPAGDGRNVVNLWGAFLK